MVLLLDIGNTRIKWAQWLNGKLTPQQTIIHRGINAEDWSRELFRERFRPSRLLVSNVAGPGMQALITGEAERLWQVKPEFASTSAFAAGVTHAYTDVSAHGIDRWLALIAAYQATKGAACVIDAGTAVTVDGVDAKGLHLGGLILPGVQMMVDALLDKTGDIARQARKLSKTANTDTSLRGQYLATNTAKAVANGALLAVAAAADRAAVEVGLQAQTQSGIKVFLTGGDAARVIKAMQTPAELVDDLVLRGLALLAPRQ